MGTQALVAVSSVLSDPAAWGAFLTGVGSVLGATISIKRTKRRADDMCQTRIDDIHKAFEAGTQFERRGVRK